MSTGHPRRWQAVRAFLRGGGWLIMGKFAVGAALVWGALRGL